MSRDPATPSERTRSVPEPFGGGSRVDAVDRDGHLAQGDRFPGLGAFPPMTDHDGDILPRAIDQEVKRAIREPAVAGDGRGRCPAPALPKRADAGTVPDVHRVLVVPGHRRWVDTDLVDRPVAPTRTFRLEGRAVWGVRDLRTLIRTMDPKLLLIDARLCAGFDRAELRRLRGTWPSTDWVLAWDGTSTDWVDTILASQASGGVTWQTEPRGLAKALDAILRGELWFSRKMLSRLYLHLHDALQTASAAGTNGARADGTDPLTCREREVMALVRRGLTNQRAAERLGISVNTVKKHLASALRKRGLHSRRQARV